MSKGYNTEIITAIMATVFVFAVTIVTIVFVLLFYQKKRFLHIQQLNDIQLQYARQLLQSQLEMQEHTFNTISKEIHDNVGQILSLAKIQVNIIGQSENVDPLLLTDVKESITKAMTDLRDIAHSLNSDRIRLTGLVEMTNHELQRIGRLGIVQTFLFTNGEEVNIKEQKKLIILRIIQEGLQNTLKHARANKIEIFFHYLANSFCCEIKDDGVGFDDQQVNKKDGLGLQNIINRAELIGGQATISSIVNTGTTIKITLPYE